MEKYLEVTTIIEIDRVDQSCEILERAGIPVVIRHVDIVRGESTAPGFTLLVPSQYTNHAQTLIGEHII